MFCYAVLYVLSSFGIILMGKREFVSLLCLSARCLVTVIVLWLFLTISWVSLQYVIVVFPSHTYTRFRYNGLWYRYCKLVFSVLFYCVYHVIKFSSMLSFRVKKSAKIRSRYIQVPHLTQDANGKVTNTQLDITNESQGVSSFPIGDHRYQ